MREEIAYQEMQEELAAEEQPSADAAPQVTPSGGTADASPSPDPTRKERAYPGLPSEGTKR